MFHITASPIAYVSASTMAKKKNKKPQRQNRFSDQESLYSADTCSLSTSICSSGDSKSSIETTFATHNESIEEDTVDDFEFKLHLILDSLQSSKMDANRRIASLDALRKAMTSRVCTDYFDN